MVDIDRADDKGTAAVVADYPLMAAERGRVERCPRRVRAWAADELVLDTSAARYVWEFPFYPQFYVPVGDVIDGALVDEDRRLKTQLGAARRCGLRAGERIRPAAARVYDVDDASAVAGLVRFEWDALDAWFEEDEEVFVHPRNPYVRVDALRSQRLVRVELDSVVLAQSSSPVMVYETGLPTRFYLPRTDVAWPHLVASQTESRCPYKGKTTGYWRTRSGTDDIAWSYEFPTPAMSAIAGLVAFYDERVDTFVDGELRPRPTSRHA